MLGEIFIELVEFRSSDLMSAHHRVGALPQRTQNTLPLITEQFPRSSVFPKKIQKVQVTLASVAGGCSECTSVPPFRKS